jgi:hypothetical protein
MGSSSYGHEDPERVKAFEQWLEEQGKIKRIPLKYEGRCIKCGRTIPAGETAYWEKDKGVWHVDCTVPTRETSHKKGDRVSRNLWTITAGSVIVAFVLGGLVLGPVLAPNIGYFQARTVERSVTLTLTETSLATVTEAISQMLTTSAATQKWVNPSDPNVINWADAGKYVGKTKTVEGTIVRTFRSSTNTVFLDFHDPYQGYFEAVIFASALKNFSFKPEDFYRGKEVRINGLIKLYQGAPEIIVENPSQIEVAGMGFNYP